MIFEPILNLFRGTAVTIPPLDGAFRPNTKLDDAAVTAAVSEPDNLVVFAGQVITSSGNALFAIKAGSERRLIEAFEAPVTAVAASKAGELAVGLESGKLLVDGKNVTLPAGIRCITALAFDNSGTLWLANGSSSQPPSGWAADLMLRGRSGSVWKKELGKDRFEQIAADLAFPYGLLPTERGVVVSESWANRLIHIDASNGNRTTVLGHLPGYPARLSRAADGGAWLSLFAPRNRLIEFILQEKQYRLDMIAEVPRDYWIAPSLSPSRSFLEPLQCGGIKTMGIHKPWAPSRSYGLVVRLNADMLPLYSLHSRANGTRHGVCSILETGGQLLVASKGGDQVLVVPATSGEVL